MNTSVVAGVENHADVHLARVDHACAVSTPGHGPPPPDADSPGRYADTDNLMPYSVVVFRDPDNIQLELFHMDG